MFKFLPHIVTASSIQSIWSTWSNNTNWVCTHWINIQDMFIYVPEIR